MNEDKLLTSKDLIVPIYLNTDALLDLVASIEGGFALVEKVNTKISQNQDTERNIQGVIGISGALSNLLGLKFDVLKGQKQGSGSETLNESERFHTYGSLLHRFREYLKQNNLLVDFIDANVSKHEITPSDFIELRGNFQPNPLATSLISIDKLLQLIDLAPNTSTSLPKPNKTPNKQSQTSQMEGFRKFLQGMISDLEPEGIRTYIITASTRDAYKGVATIFTKYLRDQSRTELTNRDFRVLGKIIQVIPNGSDIKIDLLSGTGMGSLGEPIMQQLLTALVQMQTAGLKMPQMQTEISAPAIQIVPIAIYV